MLLSQIADDILVKDILELSPSKADIRLMVANFDRLILASSDSQVDIRLDELDQWGMFRNFSKVISFLEDSDDNDMIER